MRKISAVICELNPLHDGHRHIFKCAKEDCDILLAVMSGNFVQRGESAVYDKYRRAEDALMSGADIVVELPFPFSAASAEFFALSGVRIAEGLGCDTLCFGSECGDIDALKKAGRALNSDAYRNGMSGVGRSAELRAMLLKEICPDLPESLFSSPNDILGAEYCRRAKIEAVAIKRITAESATSIRERTLKEKDNDMLSPERLRDIEYCFFRTLRSFDGEYAENCGGVGERLHKSAHATVNSEEWELSVRTKQYTNARLRRAALFALCGVSDEMLKKGALYTRLLGANERGRDYLSAIRKRSDFPIITNLSQSKELSEDARSQFELSSFADSIYALCLGNTDPGFFAKHKPMML
ncbi:MAG: nucleotidyltransferase family protein [Ruminococcaceae bacterium]|nr:nucleotidyltransferase family protein [Oscillospiraceae bacterium]